MESVGALGHDRIRADGDRYLDGVVLMRFPGTVTMAVGFSFIALWWMSGAQFWLGFGIGLVGLALVILVRR